ncbi:DoxX family protein [Haloferula chungangensis]|uniref:DoxX family protein n=1 Tax=Haloferula chungangensis TaxID=1048331 RepID=A0ABW2L4S8_9BACT
MKHASNSLLAYWGLRFAFGLSFLVHGGVRLPKLQAFAKGMSAQFQETFLAGLPSLAMAYVIPIAEVCIALSILAGGKFIRWGAFAGCVLMGVLMTGTSLLEKWDLLPSQLIHLLVFYLILHNPHTPGAGRLEATSKAS